jgi:nitrile hydratase beta subunit
MDGIHDLGGMEGFGSISIEENEPVFHSDWEGRVMALTMLMFFWGKWNLDGARRSLENLPPEDYLSFSYYEKWLASLVNLMVNTDLITRKEVMTGRAIDKAVKRSQPLDGETWDLARARGRPSSRMIDAHPLFNIGDRVLTAEHMHSGHHRLPRYVRGRKGEIILHHGAHVFPDSNAVLAGEDPQHLYTVKFFARDLWGEEAAVRDTVTVDLWEGYLAPE